MPIRKQEYYEGAALHRLLRTNRVREIAYVNSTFVVNGYVLHLKYSTATRSPWGFTFKPAEQQVLAKRRADNPIVLGLVCGADGVCALPYDEYLQIAPIQPTALRVSCARAQREHYVVQGPSGLLNSRVSLAAWQEIIKEPNE